MRYPKLTTLFALPVAFALTLGAAPQPSEAGKACKKLKLSSPCIKASDIRNNQVRSNHVKNGSLRAVDLKEEAGADFAGGDQSETLVLDDTIYRSVEVTAPAPGVVIVHASGSFHFSQAVEGTRCSITTGTTRDNANQIWGFKQATPGTVPWMPFAGTRGFNVSAGTTTFNLVCDSDTGAATIVDTYMTAEYYPTRY